MAEKESRRAPPPNYGAKLCHTKRPYCGYALLTLLLSPTSFNHPYRYRLIVLIILVGKYLQVVCSRRGAEMILEADRACRYFFIDIIRTVSLYLRACSALALHPPLLRTWPLSSTISLMPSS